MFTTAQLGWLGVGAALPYLLLRLHLALVPVLGASSPWLATALAVGFGRREGRRLDAFAGDWVLFQLQPRHLVHPGEAASTADPFQPVDGPLGWSPESPGGAR